MPKVRLSFSISGHITQTVDVPQSVVDEYRRQVDSDNPDCEALDKLLEPYIKYENVLDDLDNAEDIELTELKEKVAELAK